MKRGIDKWISAVSAVMWTSYWTSAVKSQLGQKAKLPVYVPVVFKMSTGKYRFFFLLDGSAGGDTPHSTLPT